MDAVTVFWIGVSVGALFVGGVGTKAFLKEGGPARWLIAFWLACIAGALIGISNVVRVYDSVLGARVRETVTMVLIAMLIVQPDPELKGETDPKRFVSLRWLAVAFMALGLCIALVLPATAFHQGKLVSTWDWGIVVAEVVLGIGLVIRYLPVARGRRSRVAP